VSRDAFEAWATLRRRGGHRLATALEMLAVVCSAGVRRADLQRATRLAGAAGLTEEQVAPRSPVPFSPLTDRLVFGA